ncbi:MULTISPECIES: helix-turn-helix transcriptional regulator [Acinetobacter]|uniref:AlpA family transcriptional regulator n=1 Tax=Acinetobacter ursingii TaxID=108980 RepID=A0AA46S813_9GAMM|nr:MULTISPECIES: AlpA family transcriptional regulator [Acinetobacter]MCU4495697.1 AlpA family transcriptional regulator [Acinetobacter ursingii]OTS33565.1 AlpA family transcriptional regulator [Acinetobacter pittii]UYF75195.1 AlpA family transcriptional regulator [Acinetobacter ursingii]
MYLSDDQMFHINQIIRIKEVIAVTGISRSVIYEKLNPQSKCYDSTFPKPIKLSVNCVGWSAFEVNQWIKGRLANR